MFVTVCVNPGAWIAGQISGVGEGRVSDDGKLGAPGLSGSEGRTTDVYMYMYIYISK